MGDHYRHRLATMADLDALKRLMNEAIAGCLPRFLTPEQTEASYEIMGLDTQLIEDGTYFVILDGEEIVAGGGWSFRATMYGGDHTQGRNPRRLDPAREPARIRAMYVSPRHARRGLGRRILALCEAAARAAGFARVELVATMAGLPLYQACGYVIEREFSDRTRRGVAVPLAAMSKRLE